MKQAILILLNGCMFTLFGCSTAHPLAKVDPANVTQIVFSHPNGGLGLSDQNQINTLIEAMRSAKPDSTLYDMAKTLSIEIQRGETSLPRIPAGGPLFDVDGQQYYSNEFEGVVRSLLNQQKKHNN